MTVKTMTYEEAKTTKQSLEKMNTCYSKLLNDFPKNEMGMTPEHIRKTDEYKEAKKNYDNSFRRLQEFNSFFTKTFKKEYAKDRKNKYTTKL